MRKIKNIIILAGGQSSRFWPLEHKNLFTFLGKPLIVNQIERFIPIGDHLFVVSHADTALQISNAVSSDAITVVTQEGEGQASALLTIKDSIEGEVLIVNGGDVFEDTLLEIFFKKIEEEEVDGVFAAIELDTYFPGGFLRHEGDRVLEVVEKPGVENMPSRLMKTVFDYYKDWGMFEKILRLAKTVKDDQYEVAISNYIQEGKDIRFVLYKDAWATLKYPWHTLAMMNFYMRRLKSFRGENVSVHNTAIISGDVYMARGVKVYEYAKIVGPCYIGENTVIGNFVFVNKSMIGPNSCIGGYSEVTRSYVGGNVWLHRNYIGDSVLQGDTLFGAGAVTANFRFDADTIKSSIKGEKINSNMQKMGAIIGKNVKVGVNATLMPGVKIGAGARLAPGEVVKKDVLENS